MKPITPFLWFDKEAEQAAKFYVSVFKKKSKIINVTRYGSTGPGAKGTVMVVDFEVNGQRFSALNGGPIFKHSPAISFVVHCKTQKEIDTYWKKLLAGGGQPSQCGWLTDKFGVSWQIVPDLLLKTLVGKDKAKAERIMAAQMKMVKFDVAALEAAAKGPKRKAA
ncbi:MAG TPA: VOC family protein [Polyangia bacterium]|jgi:predicted 3-demethylubiquinone-9 3-methyltransferase (glyoxalase superfamily)|nr:VOC family protein [Polyangia bacterium]